MPSTNGRVPTWLLWFVAITVGGVNPELWARDGAADALPMGVGRFTFAEEGDTSVEPMQVYYIKPKRFSRKTPVWIVMHGVDRNAAEYRDNWVELNEDYHALILVPEFSAQDYPGSRAYNLGNLLDDDGQRIDRALWSYSVIDRLFDHVVQREGLRSGGYCIFGHSAGAQFVQRLVLFVPDAKIRLAIVANAGWYTLPDPAVAYPYGIADAPVDEDGIRTAFSKPLVVLLGKDDADPDHKHLRKTPEAEAQGPHRLARGRYFFECASAAGKSFDVRLAWRYIEVPGVGHSNSRMAPVAAKLMARARAVPKSDRE